MILSTIETATLSSKKNSPQLVKFLLVVGIIDRYEDEGLEGLIDKRLNQISHRRAPVDEVVRLVDCYRKRHDSWNAKHFYAWYKRDGGERSYSWVKNRLQDAQLVPKATKRGAHRKKRERSPYLA